MPVARAKLARATQLDSRFFKTKLCSFWEEGRCLRSNDCKYAHGEHQLSRTPDLSKTALCRELLRNGECSVPDCPFAHSHEELRATSGVYKTAMCAFFPTGRCRLGSFCRHAHHESELRQSGGAVRRDTDSLQGDAESDDELEERPQSAWERTVTMPPSLEETARVAPRLPPGDWDQASKSPTKAANTWADLTEKDDDDLEGMEDMWSRLQTMPASTAYTSGQEISSPLQPLPSKQWSFDGARQWSRETSENSETACRTADSVRSICSDWSSMRSATHDSMPLMMPFEDAPKPVPVGPIAPMPVVAMMPVLLVQGGPALAKPYPVMLPEGPAADTYPQELRAQLEASAKALRDAAPTHYED